MTIAPTLAQAAAWTAAVGFAGLAVFQLLLAFGAPLGHLAWGGRRRRLPPHLRAASLGAALLVVLAAACVLERAGVVQVLGWPAGAVRGAVWALVGLFALSTAGNLASRSRAERRVGTPLALVLTAACLVVALAG